MGVGSAGNGIDSLNNPVQSRIRSDGHVRAAEIIIDWAHLSIK